MINDTDLLNQFNEVKRQWSHIWYLAPKPLQDEFWHVKTEIERLEIELQKNIYTIPNDEIQIYYHELPTPEQVVLTCTPNLKRYQHVTLSQYSQQQEVITQGTWQEVMASYNLPLSVPVELLTNWDYTVPKPDFWHYNLSATCRKVLHADVLLCGFEPKIPWYSFFEWIEPLC